MIYFLGMGMIGLGTLVKQLGPWKESIPAFLRLSGSGALKLFDKLPNYYRYYHLTCYGTLYAMSTSPTADEGPSLPGPLEYRISNTGTDHRVANSIYGNSNTGVGNVSNSYNTINVGMDEESLRIQEWLSPLEPYKRHQDVRNRRLDGVGEWVLRRSEFESWRKGQEGSVNLTLLCYGGQGVGKTYIR